MNAKVVAVVTASIVALSGCAAKRFDSVVGQPKSYAIEALGMPDKIVKIETGGEIWSYPTSSPRVSDPTVDTSPDAASPITQGIAEGISDQIIRGVFGNGPARYVYVGADGLVQRWEFRRWH
jgi:hypothetical protein